MLRTKIERVGNDFFIVIPSVLEAAIGLQNGEQVEVEMSARGDILIRREAGPAMRRR